MGLSDFVAGETYLAGLRLEVLLTRLVALVTTGHGGSRMEERSWQKFVRKEGSECASWSTGWRRWMYQQEVVEGESERAEEERRVTRKVRPEKKGAKKAIEMPYRKGQQQMAS